MPVLGRYAILRLLGEGKLKIEPFNPEVQIRENGIDLALANEYALPNDDAREIDLESAPPEEAFIVKKNVDRIVIPPQTFALLVTREYLKLPKDVVGLCNLRSSIARWGLVSSPTVVDSGFEGQLVIEVFNTRRSAIILRPGMRFLHLVLVTADDADVYRSFYQGQRGVTLPRNIKVDVALR